MQLKKTRTSNEDRTRMMRARLIAAARELFVAHGFAGTSTPAIVAAAGATRGALYHHFADKSAIFRAVAEAESEAVAQAVEASGEATGSALERLRAGAVTWLDCMARPGRARILLIDAPAVLGAAAVQALQARTGERTLKDGLSEAIAAGEIKPLPLEALVSLLSAVFDRAALRDLSDESKDDTRDVVAALIDGLATRS